MLNILYEDEDIIVCEKPVGILSQPGISVGFDMLSLVSQYLQQNGEKVNVGLVHRLDCNVGGAMLFSKKDCMTSKLSMAMQDRSFTKEYLAVVHGCMEESKATLKDYLYKDTRKGKSFVVDRMRKGVKEASLWYQVLETVKVEEKELSLLYIRLHTGRTHQIRVQFSARKHALLGDGKYGSKENHCEIALWSHHLEFEHPRTKNKVSVKSYPQKIYPWDLFTIGKTF